MSQQEEPNTGPGPLSFPPAGKLRATNATRNAPLGRYRLVLWGISADGNSAAWVEGDFDRCREAVDKGLGSLNAQIDSFAVYNDTGRRMFSRNTRPASKFDNPISVTALAGLAYTGDQRRSKHIKPKSGEYRRK